MISCEERPGNSNKKLYERRKVRKPKKRERDGDDEFSLAWSTAPDEILLRIFCSDSLLFRDNLSITAVCSQWRRVGRDDTIWVSVYRARFGAIDADGKAWSRFWRMQTQWNTYLTTGSRKKGSRDSGENAKSARQIRWHLMRGNTTFAWRLFDPILRTAIREKEAREYWQYTIASLKADMCAAGNEGGLSFLLDIAKNYDLVPITNVLKRDPVTLAVLSRRGEGCLRLLLENGIKPHHNCSVLVRGQKKQRIELIHLCAQVGNLECLRLVAEKMGMMRTPLSVWVDSLFRSLCDSYYRPPEWLKPAPSAKGKGKPKGTRRPMTKSEAVRMGEWMLLKWEVLIGNRYDMMFLCIDCDLPELAALQWDRVEGTIGRDALLDVVKKMAINLVHDNVRKKYMKRLRWVKDTRLRDDDWLEGVLSKYSTPTCPTPKCKPPPTDSLTPDDLLTVEA